VFAVCLDHGQASCSTFAEQKIDDPTSPDMWPRPAKVPQNLSVGAAGFFEGIRKDGEARSV
jgi:hypothetical protein